MAYIKQSTFGQLSGSLGDYYCRVFNGKTVICRKPAKKSFTPCKAHINSMNKFTAAVHICSAINSIKILSKSWKDSSSTGLNGYNKMTKENMLRILTDNDISNILLVPREELFTTELISISLNAEILVVTFEPLTVFTSPGFERTISCQGVLQLTEPIDPVSKSQVYIPVISKTLQHIPGEIITFEIRFTSSEYEIIKGYSGRKTLLNLAVKDKEGAVIEYSKSSISTNL